MKKFKTYAFWVALSSAIVILMQSLGKLFGFEIESVLVENVIMSICGILVVLGIVTKSTDTDDSSQNDSENLNDKTNKDSASDNTNEKL